eukprot:TRINITY_DN5482_c0_g1_i1.p1 TRINITY_DN5482_c0_g1~~TRINITY_DN5482_c0_g1_i1.p1  ORF type:complete len:287 (+),score=108.70 TRINITY_DN5482_c0_g1_i1:72-863(+)
MRRAAAAAPARASAGAAARWCATTGISGSVLSPTKVDPRLLQNNLRWRESKLAKDPNFFSNLAAGQNPDYLWFGCSDSRVPANEIIGADCGAVFVHRNIANVVHGNDLNAMSVLQFAVEHLKVPHIIVCGHYDCGGVRAAMRPEAVDPPLDLWLRNIRDVTRLHKTELDAIADPEEKHRKLVELNILESCFNLFKTTVVQRRRVQTHLEGKPFAEPRIHAMVFDHTTGVLKDLAVDWKKWLKEYAPIYQVSHKPTEEGPLEAD